MKKNIFIITLLVGCCSLSVWAQKQEKTITVEVNNNWNRAKTDEPVVINLRDLHTGFKVKSAVVMEGSSEIPSQLDDLNRDRKMDELAFVTNLPAHGRKTFQVTLSSEKSTKTYPARVYAEMFIADPRKGSTGNHCPWYEQYIQYGTTSRSGTGIGTGRLSSLL